MGLVKDCGAGTFEFPRCAILKPNVPGSGRKTEENTGSGMGGIQFGSVYMRLFHCNVTAKNVRGPGSRKCMLGMVKCCQGGNGVVVCS